MKSFAKLGLLLALVVAGRYFRSTEHAAPPAQNTALVTPAKHDTLHFATYATTQVNLVTPVNRRSQGAATPAEEYAVWY